MSRESFIIRITCNRDGDPMRVPGFEDSMVQVKRIERRSDSYGG